MGWPVFMLLGFACGSIPFGLIIARGRGIDIRKHGSGNIGATNVGRVLGAKLGLFCFALDVLKGALPTLGAGLAMGVVHGSIVAQPIDRVSAWWWLGVCVACVMGHMFSPFVGFRGGKGVATGLGAMLGLWPYLTVPALGAFVLWCIIAAIWRYVSLASCIAALSLAGWVLLGERMAASRGHAPDMLPFYIVTGAMGLLVVYKHRGNIRRLLSGTESKLGKRVDPSGAPRQSPSG